MESKEKHLTKPVNSRPPSYKQSNSGIDVHQYAQIQDADPHHGNVKIKIQTADINKQVTYFDESKSMSGSLSHLSSDFKSGIEKAKTAKNLKTEQDQLVVSDGSKSEESISKGGTSMKTKETPPSAQEKPVTQQTARVKHNESNEDSDGDSSNDDSTDLKNFVENADLGNDATTLNDNYNSNESRDKMDRQANVKLPDWKDLAELDSLPLVKSGYSIEADMKFGWKPTVKGKVLPIPFIFDSEDHYFDLEHFQDSRSKEPLPTIFLGFRPRDSFKLYRQLLQTVHPYHGTEMNMRIPSKLPPQVEKLLDNQMQNQVLGGAQDQKTYSKRIVGMQPDHKELISEPNVLHFDSMFECGNLDRVVMVSPNEYDLYMRPDTNTRGHHQWFYFRTIAKQNLGPVKFNILNFTKTSSLHEVGMKICICSANEKSNLLELASQKQTGVPPTKNDDLGWKRGGYNILYDRSKLNDIIRRQSGDYYDEEATSTNNRVFYQLSFTYDYELIDGDEVYFAQSFPYSFTRLNNYIKELKSNREIMRHTKDSTPICHSLSGVDIPYLIVTSRVHQDNFNEIDAGEHSKKNCPPDKYKKTILMTSRVHPGETNASFMMEGFMNFITSSTNQQAIELRKRIVFKIIPCINPDGVMAGNYRVSMAGNDLNRRYKNPHPKLHPIVCAIKKLISDESGPNVLNQEENKKVIAFIDLHGHSRKKSIFMYGPEFPIHDPRYLKMKIIPKIMDDQGDMFRFYSCKFRFQKSKEKTARIVLWKEFNITNCYTLEASMMGYFDQNRETKQFVQSHFYQVGKMLVQSIFEFVLIREDERRQIKARQDLQNQKDEMQKVLLKIPGKKNDNLRASPSKKDSSKSTNVLTRKIQLQSQNILSPSASSEAILPAQEVSDGGNETNLSVKKKPVVNTKDKKKQFKVTKKYKDDPVMKDTPEIEKEIVNPNEPDETEKLSESGSSGSSPDFISKFQEKKRTFQDLCDQMEKDDDAESSEENIVDEGQPEEVKISQQRPKNGGQKQPHQSDCDSDSEHDELMMKIHKNIIGLINATNVGSSDKNKKVMQSKETPNKKVPKQSVARVPSGKKNVKLDSKRVDDKKITKLPQAKKPNNLEYTSQSDVNKSEIKSKGNPKIVRRNDSKLHQQNLKRNKQSSEMEIKKQVYQNVSPAVVHPAQNQNMALNCNNFNDRIMNEQYSKHKTHHQHGPAYQLSTLSSGAQKLLNKHLANDQLRRMQLIEQQNQRAIQKEKEKNFTIYNFQSKKVEKHNLGDLNMSLNMSNMGATSNLGNQSSGRGSLERTYTQNNQNQPIGSHEEFYEKSHQQILDKLNESSPSRYNNESFHLSSPNRAMQQFHLPKKNSESNISSNDSLHRFNQFIGMGSSQKVKNSNIQPVLSHPPNTTPGKIQMKRTGIISSPLKTEFPMRNEILTQQNSQIRSFENDEPLIQSSQNQRNRRLVTVDQNNIKDLSQPILSRSPDSKPRQAQMNLGGSFFNRQEQYSLNPAFDQINECAVEESPMVGQNLPNISKNFKIQFNQTGLNMPTINETLPTMPTPEEEIRSQQKNLRQDEIFAQRGLSSQAQDTRHRPNQLQQMNQTNINALYASMDIKRNRDNVPQDYFSQPQRKETDGVRSPLDQTTIEMSTSHRFQHTVQQHGHKKVQQTIYIGDQKPIQNINSVQQQSNINKARATTNPGSRLSLVTKNIGIHQTQQHSPTSAVKAKTRQNQIQKNKNSDYQSFHNEPPGMQTIKSQLLAQSEMAKQNKQKQTRKSHRSDLIYNSIKNQKFQSLLNQSDFTNLQQDKSTNLIKEKINNQEQQISSQIPPNTVNIRTSKTIHFAARNIGQHNPPMSNRQQQYQNQYIYQQKLNAVQKSKNLNNTQQYYPHQNQQQMQRTNQQKLQRNVYNDLQELQRELGQMEPPIQNQKSYQDQFKNVNKALSQVQQVKQQATNLQNMITNNIKGSPQRNKHIIVNNHDKALQSQNNNILTQMISHQNLNKPMPHTEQSPQVVRRQRAIAETAPNQGSPGQRLVQEIRIPVNKKNTQMQEQAKTEQPLLQLHWASKGSDDSN